MNRRKFIVGLGSFFILKGAGRVWKAVTPAPVGYFWNRPSRYSICIDARYERFMESTLTRATIHQITLEDMERLWGL